MLTVFCAAFNSTQNFDSSVKSPISSVYEIALKRNMNVAFEVVSDRGPPHMKIFVTKCTVGTITATGEGSGKKVKFHKGKIFSWVFNLMKS